MSDVGDYLKASVTVPVIGYVRSPFGQKFGVPRQPNLVNVEAYIEFNVPFDTPQAFLGLTDFSHLWVIWQFHQNNSLNQAFKPMIRPPRLGGNRRIGVFASRSMYRPAPLGLSVVQLQHVEQTSHGIRLHILGADMIDGTPVLDIKPYIAYSDAVPQALSGFASEPPPVLHVVWSETALKHSSLLQNTQHLNAQQLKLIEQLLAQDPRPAYQNDNRVYGMQYAGVNIRFQIEPHIVTILTLEYVENAAPKML